jgi:calcineurin-like phosphoesterase family protein
MEIAGTTVLLNHMPYQIKPGSAESSAESRGYSIPRHAKYRPTDHGLWLLHGHVHEKWKSKGKMINVGVDVWDFYPVPITAIESLIQGAIPDLIYLNFNMLSFT